MYEKHLLTGSWGTYNGVGLRNHVFDVARDYIYKLTGLGVSQEDVETVIDQQYLYALSQYREEMGSLTKKLDEKVEDKKVRYLAARGLSSVDQVPGMELGLAKYYNDRFDPQMRELTDKTWKLIETRIRSYFDPLLGPKLNEAIYEFQYALQLSYKKYHDLEEEEFALRTSLASAKKEVLKKIDKLTVMLRIATIIKERRAFGNY